MFTLNCRGRLLTASRPLVMGIINVTPDSFYPGSRFAHRDQILAIAEKMLMDGASILDMGGQSTRPGAKQVGISEESVRVLDAIESVHHHFPEAFISVDTYHSSIAKGAVLAGASIINDVSGGTKDNDMLRVAALLNVPYICMHMKGDPEDMQLNPVYENLAMELLDYFFERRNACKIAGIKDLIIDPGFGFGKTVRHNLELISHLEIFRILDCPIMIGISRKSTIYKILGTGPEEALNGSTVLHTIGLLKGAGILRVHDVKEAVEAVKLVSAIGEEYSRKGAK
ncbi:MAG: dihydropteroate synthase [Bacteroidetes bacterium]|nr:MAG: dihydropteroate synthase [Bacteroidota bacterium]